MALVTVRAVVDIPTDIGMLEIRRVIVAMTTGALEHGVVARIRVAGGTNTIRVAVIRGEVRVIERGSGPCGGRMAGVTGRREASRLVIGVGGPIVVGGMATIAGRWQRRVVVVHVALRALHAGVRAREWKCSLGMIKCCRHPCRGGVADLAGLWDPGGRVVRIRRALVILQVARDAGGRSEAEVSVRVALIALQVGMAAS